MKSEEGKRGEDEDNDDLNWKSRQGNDDLFDEREKIQLGLRE